MDTPSQVFFSLYTIDWTAPRFDAYLLGERGTEYP